MMCSDRTSYTYEFIIDLIAKCNDAAPVGLKPITRNSEWTRKKSSFNWESTGLMMADPSLGGRWTVMMTADETTRYRRLLQNIVNRVTPSTLKTCTKEALAIPVDSKDKYEILISIIIDKFCIEEQYFDSFLQFVQSLQTSVQVLRSIRHVLVKRICKVALDRAHNRMSVSIRVLSHFYKHGIIPYKLLQPHIQWCVRTSTQQSIDTLHMCVDSFAERMVREQLNEVELMSAAIQKRVIHKMSGRIKFIGMDIVEILQNTKDKLKENNRSTNINKRRSLYRPPSRRNASKGSTDMSHTHRVTHATSKASQK